MKEMCLYCKVMMDKKLFVLTDIPMCEDCYNKTLRE